MCDSIDLHTAIPALLDHIKETPEYEQLMANNAGIPAYVMDEGETSEWWTSDEANSLYLNLIEVVEDDETWFDGSEG